MPSLREIPLARALIARPPQGAGDAQTAIGASSSAAAPCRPSYATRACIGALRRPSELERRPAMLPAAICWAKSRPAPCVVPHPHRARFAGRGRDRGACGQRRTERRSPDVGLAVNVTQRRSTLRCEPAPPALGISALPGFPSVTTPQERDRDRRPVDRSRIRGLRGGPASRSGRPSDPADRRRAEVVVGCRRRMAHA